MNCILSSATFFDGDLSKWDVSGVKNKPKIFNDVRLFEVDISSKCDVSGITDMIHMFDLASSFNHGLAKWDMSNVGNMERVFYCVTAFNGDESIWDVSRVAYMNYMFLNAERLDAVISE